MNYEKIWSEFYAEALEEIYRNPINLDWICLNTLGLSSAFGGYQVFQLFITYEQLKSILEIHPDGYELEVYLQGCEYLPEFMKNSAFIQAMKKEIKKKLDYYTDKEDINYLENLLSCLEID